jgi:hypothetical protein
MVGAILSGYSATAFIDIYPLHGVIPRWPADRQDRDTCRMYVAWKTLLFLGLAWTSVC